MLNVEVVSFATAATAFVALAALVARSGLPRSLQRSLLLCAAVATALWAGVVTWQAAFGGFLIIAQLLELLRDLTWLSFLLAMLRGTYPDTESLPLRIAQGFAAVTVLIVTLMLLSIYRIGGGDALEAIAGNDVLAGHLAIAVAGLVFVEQLYRNTPPVQRRALKYLCLGVGGMLVYDFYLYSDALLFQRVSATLWDARGFMHAMVVPLMVIALRRNVSWSVSRAARDLFVSRRMAFHTTALAATAVYLIVMGTGAWYLREFGGDWGIVLQTLFLAGAILVLAVLLFSGQIRAGLRVFINKHFFSYKYDYREEWLRFIRTLAAGNPETQLHERVVQAIAQIVESPAGVLWMRRGDGPHAPVAHWNLDTGMRGEEPADGAFAHFLEEREWVVNLDDYVSAGNNGRLSSEIPFPAWLRELAQAWLVVPLILHTKLVGFVVVTRAPNAPVRRDFNWEDCDLLKTVGRQAASHLVQMESARALAESRQFEAFNRTSAFVVHDMKNLISQLTLVVSNAARHKHNPRFMEDAIQTVSNSVSRMNRLLEHLRSGGQAVPENTDADLTELLAEVVRQIGAGSPPILLECPRDSVRVRCDGDRLAAVIGHVVQNARDATPPDGRISVRMQRADGMAMVEVEDTGCGMDDAFVRERLFRPFETTKGSSGMGIGAYETREYVRSLGGEVEVHSRVGHGTLFRLRLPYNTVRAQNIGYDSASEAS